MKDIKGDKPENLVAKFAEPSQPITVRLTALGYYYQHGSTADLPKVQAFSKDRTKVPNCPSDAEGCAWQCGVMVDGKQVPKDVTTLGEYVEYCIVPALSSREPASESSDEKTPEAAPNDKK